ncbi:PorP/SprF family type IX secretion system membrane protein [Pedobacter insulae]|uniref:Type IX secretion system membrane protein, PorP/SprF family n=1 Tax=Pedobacter insulae TaxID=414048 RepID=A0A1I2ZBN2_9SPHI|nr:type IX secretion system membrane protein PorP/SprF [Pedobacter insulae]SFH34979.1 type IX secretion system membrane protein, PorP/SprF family [Pedobacter insulae]
MKKIILSGLFFLMLFNAYGQQEAQYGQYVFNGLYINPAYAGYKDEIYFQAFYRAQWTGIKGGPRSLSVSIDAPVSDGKLGLGALISTDKIGAQTSLNAMGNLAYRIKLNDDGTRAVSFGLGLGVLQMGINGSLLTPNEIGDTRIPTGNQTNIVPDARAGIQYSSERFFIGFSANSLIAPYLTKDKNFDILTMKAESHFYLTTATIYRLNEDLIFKPSFLIKDDLHGPTSVDLNAFLLFRDKLWLGGLYRTSMKMYPKKNLQKELSNKSALGFIAEFFVKPNFRVGYGYDYSLSKLSAFDHGSHELSIGFYLNTIRSQKKLCNCF